MKKEAWEKFVNSGRVEDYLKFKKKRYSSEMGTEVIIKKSKRDSNGRDGRRNRSKNK